jgi:cytosine deaminase
VANIIEKNNAICIALMWVFIAQSPQIWFEDIGECDCAE